MSTSHDVMYAPPAGASYGFSDPQHGRGFSADDLQREQLKQIDKIFEEQLPALVADGTSIFVEELRQEERMEAFEAKMRASLSPEHMARAREVLRRRAAEVLKAEAVKLSITAADTTGTTSVSAPVIAAETRVQAEKRQNARR